MTVSMSIGPSGQPPSTTYTYDVGLVTLSPRPATQRTAAELLSVVRSIKIFKMAVLNSDSPDIIPPSPPLIYRSLVEAETPSVATCRFRCPGANAGPNLTIDAQQDLTTRVTSFEPRQERVITWGDFDLFFRWMMLLGDLASR